MLCNIINTMRISMNTAVPDTIPERTPQPGDLVQVRSRRWPVEEATSPSNSKELYRYRWPHDVRAEVLARLLLLNVERDDQPYDSVS